jgi:hypothetical protein
VTFLPKEFEVPSVLEIERFRMRPITIHEVVKHYEAVMSSAGHLTAGCIDTDLPAG